MINISEEFQNAIRNGEKLLAKVEVNYTDVFEDSSINVYTNEQINVFYPFQLTDGLNRTSGKIASLDGSWVLDGSFISAPANKYDNQMGWWSKQFSDSNGNFSSVSPPTITIEFSERSLNRYSVSGDYHRNEYPVHFKVLWLNVNNDILYQDEVTNNTKVEYEVILPNFIHNVKKIRLIIYKWNLPHRQAKITELFSMFKEVYTDEDILSINLLEEKELTNIDTLPIGNISTNELNVTLRNDNGIFDLNNVNSPVNKWLKPNRLVKAWLGYRHEDDTEEYLPLGVFWTKEWEIQDYGLSVSFTARDRLSLLEDSIYTGGKLLNNMPIKLSFIDIFENAGITNYSIDDNELQNVYLNYNIFPRDISHKEALRLLAQVSTSQIYCDRYGKIIVDRINPNYSSENINPTLTIDNLLYVYSENGNNISYYYNEYTGELYITSLFLISKEEYFSKQTKLNDEKLVNVINVPYKEDYLDPNITILYNNTLTLAGSQEIKIIGELNEYYKSAINLSGGSDIIYITYTLNEYHNKYEMTLTNTTSVPVTFDVQLQGRKILQKEADIVTYSDNESFVLNGRKALNFPENPLLQREYHAKLIAQSILNYYATEKRDIDLTWIGNPSFTLGDFIFVEDDYMIYSYQLVSNEIKFDGSLVGNLGGKDVE